MANQPIEQRVPDYQDLMNALLDKVKVDLENYVRDIAIAVWNAALSEACWETETYTEDDGETKAEMLKELAHLIQAKRA